MVLFIFYDFLLVYFGVNKRDLNIYGFSSYFVDICMQNFASKVLNLIKHFLQKRRFVIFLLVIYTFSYILNSLFFVDWNNVFAEDPLANNNLVVVLVEDDLYDEIEDDVEWYAVEYIQKRVSNGRALVLPINTDSVDGIGAQDIVKILENLYFDGIQWHTSTLLWVVLLWDVPLPVVESDGFVYPSIYPYVDFEDQQFIYSQANDFFVYNNIPSAQPELWHGIIDFETTEEYEAYFDKLRRYVSQPSSFVGKRFWYDDFMAINKYFSIDTVDSYINNFLFVEDLWYRRFSNLMLDMLKWNYLDKVAGVLNWVNNISVSTGTLPSWNGDLFSEFNSTVNDYISGMNALSEEGSSLFEPAWSQVPTMVLKQTILGFLKPYINLLNPNYLVLMRDNVAAAGRWNEQNSSGKRLPSVDSHFEKITQRDSRIINDLESKFQPLIIEFNNLLESAIDQKIEDEEYYMTVPIIKSYQYVKYENKEKELIPYVYTADRCEKVVDDVFVNFYFGMSLWSVLDAEQLSIYRGTFRNYGYVDISDASLSDIQDWPRPVSDLTWLDISKKSVWWSYGIFSLQVDANRAYNLMSASQEATAYVNEKIESNYVYDCGNWYTIIGFKVFCKRMDLVPGSSLDDDEDEEGDVDPDLYETTTDFAIRNRGGASVINLDQDLLGDNIFQMLSYDYKEAWKPIYDIGGSLKSEVAEYSSNSIMSAWEYPSLIKTNSWYSRYLYPKKILGLQQWDKFHYNYDDLSFVDVYDYEWDRYDKIKKIYLEWVNVAEIECEWSDFACWDDPKLKKVWHAGTMNGECEWKYEKQKIYKYKILDSRQKNVAPIAKHFNGDINGDYAAGGSVYETYENILDEINSVKWFLVSSKESFESTWSGPVWFFELIVDRLSLLNQNIGWFVLESIDATTSTWELAGYTDLLNATISSEQITEMRDWAIAGNEWLVVLQRNLQNLTMGTIIYRLNSLDPSVPFLAEWVDKMMSLVDGLLADYDKLRIAYNAKVISLYNQVHGLTNLSAELENQRNTVNNLVQDSITLEYVGCNDAKYDDLCTAISDVKAAVLPNSNFNLSIDDGQVDVYWPDIKTAMSMFYQWEIIENPDGTSSMEDAELVSIFSVLNLDFALVRSDFVQGINMSHFLLDALPSVADESEVWHIPGMNMSTKDRPIDSPRSISFQWLGWDVLDFIYPNLYHVEVFYDDPDSPWVLKLKSIDEIKESIVSYLHDVVVQYNAELLVQREAKDDYYAEHAEAYDFLATWDPLASSHRSYDLMDDDYLIGVLWEDKIAKVAELLYYQNMSFREKTPDDNIVKDIKQTRLSFDINTKIASVIEEYLETNNNKWAITSPAYRDDGYEVAFFNSNGLDYIALGNIPDIINDIQNQRKNFKSRQGSELDDTPLNDMWQQIEKECGVTDGTVPLFDWPDAFMCWLEITMEKPFDITVSYRDAQWPVYGKFWPWDVFDDFGEDLKAEFLSYADTFDQYGEQWSAFFAKEEETGPDVEPPEVPLITPEENLQYLDQAEALLQEQESENILLWVWNEDGNVGNLQEVMTYISPKIVVDRANVDDFAAELTISSIRNIGEVEVSVGVIWNECFALDNISQNLCEDPYVMWSFDPFASPVSLSLKLADHKAWPNVFMFKICLPWQPDACIKKTQQIYTVPWALDHGDIYTSADTILVESTVPVIVQAYDIYNNMIGQLLDDFELEVNVGQFMKNGVSSNVMKFNNFGKANFLYYGPKNPGQIHFEVRQVSGNTGDFEEGVWSIETDIDAVVGDLDIWYQWAVVDENDILEYSLPDSKSRLKFTDINGLDQVDPSHVPKLTLNIKSTDGQPLDAWVSVSSRNNLMTVWEINSKVVRVQPNGNWIQVPQYSFVEKNNFHLKNWQLDIYLYPGFQIWEEELVVEVPWLDPIVLKQEILPWSPLVVSLELDRDYMWENEEVNGHLEIHDMWENLIEDEITVVLQAIGGLHFGDMDNSLTLSVEWWIYDDLVLYSREKGGENYVFAYIDTGVVAFVDQMPGYDSILVQKPLIPTTNLNVLYLNLFGTDWWNQWGYFSENNKFANMLITWSDKLLAVTTQLMDPEKMNQFTFIVDANGQIKQFVDGDVFLRSNTLSDVLSYSMVLGEVWIVNLDLDFSLFEGSGDVILDGIPEGRLTPNQSELLYFPKELDSFLEENRVENGQLIVGWEVLLDINTRYFHPDLVIKMKDEVYQWLHIWAVSYGDTKLGDLIIWVDQSQLIVWDNIAQDIVLLDDSLDVMPVFAEWSTNGKRGIGIWQEDSVYPSSMLWYDSIEASLDSDLGVWFRGDFKNITLFGDGKTVWEATIPFGSHLLINIGDPLLTRIEDNPVITNTDHDGGVWDVVYSNPDKTIFKVLPLDFNNDDLQDLIVAYTDGSIEILKNYGGEQPYKLLQRLMLLAIGIKDIQVWDADGNGYDDILIWTMDNKVRAYLNNNGIFDVDWYPVCLNTNVAWWEITEWDPEDMSSVYQIFFTYMDESLDADDKTLDIVTNDQRGDIKIFYGGTTNGHANYVSNLKYTCDPDWATWQLSNMKLVKNYALKITTEYKIQDDSLIHRDGLVKPEAPAWAKNPDIEDFFEFEMPEGIENMDPDEIMMALNGGPLWLMSWNVWDLMWAASFELLRYTYTPTPVVPIYEDIPISETYYVNLWWLTWNDPIRIYKEYEDLNGGVLLNDDEVKVSVYLEALEDGRFTYIDQILWPWILDEWVNGMLSSLETEMVDGALSEEITTHWKIFAENGYKYMLDNIVLSEWDIFKISYVMRYRKAWQLMTIGVEDRDVYSIDCEWECLADNVFNHKDRYQDITIKSTDSCMKWMWIFYNTKDWSQDYKDYSEYFLDFAKKIASYNAMLEARSATHIMDFSTTLQDMWTNYTTGGDMDLISSIAGMGDVFESWDISSLFKDFSFEDWFSLDLDLWVAQWFMDGVNEELGKFTDGLCNGFDPGGDCGGSPFPFNIDFLSPGDFNVFGCSVWSFEWLPILAFPGNYTIPSPPGVIPMPIFLWYFPSGVMKWSTDTFYGVSGGAPYSSLIRLYLTPTLSGRFSLSICLWPQKAANEIPALIGDLWGNCIVLALPGKECDGGDDLWPSPIDDWMEDAASLGSCNNPVASGPKSLPGTLSNVLNSPFQYASAWEDSNVPTLAIPSGSFAFNSVIIDKDPITDDQDNDIMDKIWSIDLKAGPKIKNKVIGAMQNGLMKCVVQWRLDRQIKYILNNMTKMTIGITFPDLSNMFEWWGKLESVVGDQFGSVESWADMCSLYPDNYLCLIKAENDHDKRAGYIKEKNVQWSTIDQS